MYVSKYYTCEEIDQRLLQGYYDDFVKAGFAGTINEFWAFVLSIKDKVDKKEGYGLSKNDFTDELKAKLDEIEEKANYITKVSELENDLKFQTDEDVKKVISDLVDGADDALDTLKELAEALGNDPNFATTITNKLTELRNALTEEVNRAKEAEASLGTAVAAVQSNLEYAINQINIKIDTTKADLVADINRVEAKVDKNTEAIKDLDNKLVNNTDVLEKELKSLIQQEKDERIAADTEIKSSIGNLTNIHITDKAALEAKINEEVTNRTNSDTALGAKINEEVTNRKSDTSSLQSKIDQEKVDRQSEDQSIRDSLASEVTDRISADQVLQSNIDKESQARVSADQVLQTNIDSEAATRLAQDQILDHKIDDLKTIGESNKTEVLEKLAQEEAARIAGDNELDDKKVDKREGYSLTKNDFTDVLLAKLNGIEDKANYITKLSELINDTNYQNLDQVNAAIEKVIGSAPEVLDTLKEIADALGNDPNFAATITKKLAAITEQLNQEVQDRIAGDTVVQANLDKEIVERKEADVALKGELKGYVDDEIGKVSTNAGVITDALNKEIKDRKEADTNLNSLINKEIQDRTSADTTITSNLNNAFSKISELNLALQEAVNLVRNELNEKINTNSLAITTNTQGIEANKKSIAELSSMVSGNYSELKQALDIEVKARIEGDNNLLESINLISNNLSKEQSDRIAADQVLQENLNHEAEIRDLTDKNLDKKFTHLIGDETEARKAEDIRLRELINENATNTTTEINNLKDKLTQEIIDRTSSDEALSERVKNNTQSIQAEVVRATEKEEAIQLDLNTLKVNHQDDIDALNKALADEAKARSDFDNMVEEAWLWSD